MATYRLKSKIFAESKYDENKDKGFMGTGISGGTMLLAAGTALAGRKIYNKGLITGRWGNGSEAQKLALARRGAKYSTYDPLYQKGMLKRQDYLSSMGNIGLADAKESMLHQTNMFKAENEHRMIRDNSRNEVALNAVKNARDLNTAANITGKAAQKNVLNAMKQAQA